MICLRDAASDAADAAAASAAATANNHKQSYIYNFRLTCSAGCHVIVIVLLCGMWESIGPRGRTCLDVSGDSMAADCQNRLG